MQFADTYKSRGANGNLQINAEALVMAILNVAFALLLIFQVFGPLKGLTGDEPHYLVVAHSLVSDGDLDLWDDYNEDQAWTNFYSGAHLDPHYAPGQGTTITGQGERQVFYSTRAIGFGAYLVPFYLMGKATGAYVLWARIGIALLYACLMSLIYLVCRDLGVSRPSAVLAWAVGSFAVPLAFYSYSIYPETATALLSLLSLRLLLKWDGSSALHPVLIGLCLALLPWLGIKYTILTVVFGVGALFVVFTRARHRWLSTGLLAIAPALSALLLLLFLYVLYGSVMPSVIYTGVGENARTLAGINYQSYGAADGPVGGYVRMVLLYLFDQRDGILFYSPVYLFGIAGVVLLFREKKRFAAIPTAGFVFYWLFYAWSHWNSGHAPAGRPLVAVIWLLVVGMAVAFDKTRGTLSDWIKSFTIAVTGCWTLLFLFYNFMVYHVLLAHSEAFGNNFLSSATLPLNLAAFFPNLFNPRGIHPIPTIIMITLFIGVILLVIRSAGTPVITMDSRRRLITHGLAAGIPMLLFVFVWANAEFISPEEMQGRGAVRLVFKDNHNFGWEPLKKYGDETKGFFRQELIEPEVEGREYTAPGFWMEGGHTSRVSVVSATRPAFFIIGFRSEIEQKITVSVEGKGQELDLDGTAWSWVVVKGEDAADWTNRCLLRIKITTPLGFRPSDRGNRDTRYLGCRVAVYATGL